MQIIKILIRVFIFTVIFSAGIICVFGQEKFSDLKDKRITIKMDNTPFGDVIDYLINKYDIAVGFEESILDSDHNDFDFDTNLPFTKNKNLISSDGNTQISIASKRKYIVGRTISVNADSERLEDVLNTIVRQMKNYNWEINDGVVNIFPSQGRDVKFESLLKTKVKRFYLKQSDIIRAVRLMIYILPEFKEFLSDNNLNVSNYRSGWLDGLDRGLPAKLEFTNITFKELLNRVTKVKRGGWILKKNDQPSDKNKEYIEIDI